MPHNMDGSYLRRLCFLHIAQYSIQGRSFAPERSMLDAAYGEPGVVLCNFLENFVLLNIFQNQGLLQLLQYRCKILYK